MKTISAWVWVLVAVGISAMNLRASELYSVSPRSGEISLAQQDHELPTPVGRVPLTRSYDASEKAGLWGPGWRLDFLSVIQFVDQSRFLVVQAGKPAFFLKNKSLQTFEGPLGAQASFKGKEWVIQSRDGVTSRYDEKGLEVSRTDADGNKISFTYDNSGRITQITALEGYSLKFRYAANGLLVAIADSSGRKSEYQYDASRRLSQVRDADGWTTAYSYDKGLRLSEILFPSGEKVQFTYDSSGRVSGTSSSREPSLKYTYGQACRVTRQDGYWWETVHDNKGSPTEWRDSLQGNENWQWDEKGRLASQKFRDGSTETYTYDELDRPIKEITGRGDTLETTYDSKSNRPLAISLNGAITRFAYDAKGNRVSVATPAGRVTTYTYDDSGRVASISDGEGRTVRYQHDSLGNVIKQTGADGGVLSWTYDDVGRLVKSLDAVGAATEYEYDSRGQLVVVTAPGGVRTTYHYDDNGRLESETQGTHALRYHFNQRGLLARTDYPDGTFVTLDYDDLGNPIALVDSLGRATKKQYNAGGNLVRTILPNGAVAGSARDASGKVQTLSLGAMSSQFVVEDGGRTFRYKDAAGNEYRLVANKMGRVAETVLPGGGTERRTYDPDGLLESVTLPMGDTWRYWYDKSGLLKEIRFPDGAAETRAYDSMGRTASVAFPWGGATSYQYGSNGLLLEATNARGEKISYQYDPLGRLNKKQTPLETWTYSYDAEGKLLQVTNGRFTVRYSYDSLSRLIETEYPEWGKTLHYQYDNYGRVASRSEPGGRQTLYGYDQQGSLAKIANEKGEAFTFTYDDLGRISSRKAPNGTLTQYSYDDGGRVKLIAHKDASGRTIAARGYSYDAAGHPAEVQDEQGKTTSYRYDAEGRVISEEAGPRRNVYVYGLGGNRSSSSNASGGASYEYDKGGRLTRAGDVSLSYDADGNLISRHDPSGTTRYAYDVENNLIKVELPGGKTVTYGYGPWGERISREEGGRKTLFLLDSKGILQELGAADFKTRSAYVYSSLDQPIMMSSEDGEARFFHQDAMGTVLAVSDDKGKVVARYDLDAFGNNIVPEPGMLLQPFRFAGRPFDPTTGLYDLRARFYDPQLGRFISRGPLHGEADQPLTFPPYLYANNNPLEYFDPFGQDAYKYATGTDWALLRASEANQFHPDQATMLQVAFRQASYLGDRPGLDEPPEGWKYKDWRREQDLRRLEIYTKIFENTMGEAAANDYNKRCIDRLNKDYVWWNRRSGPDDQYKLIGVSEPTPTVKIQAVPAAAAAAPEAAAAATAPEVGGGLTSGGAASFKPLGPTGREIELNSYAAAAGIGTMAISAADAFGENYDLHTGQWKEDAFDNLDRKAYQYLKSPDTLEKAGMAAGLGVAGYAAAGTTAGLLIAGAGAAAAGVGLVYVAGDRVVAASREAYHYSQALDREAGDAYRAGVQAKTVADSFPDILESLERKSAELDGLRPKAQAAFQEIKALDREIGNAKNTLQTRNEKLSALLQDASRLYLDANSMNPTAAPGPITAQANGLLEQIKAARKKACDLADGMQNVSAPQDQQTAVGQAGSAADDADAKVQQLSSLLAGAPTKDTSPLQTTISSLEEKVGEVNDLVASMSGDMTAIDERIQVCEKDQPVIERAAALQADILSNLRLLRNFEDPFNELPSIQARTEPPLPDKDESAATLDLSRQSRSDAAKTYGDAQAGQALAQKWLESAGKLLPATAQPDPQALIGEATALAQQARDCADRCKQTAAGSGTAGGGFNEVDTTVGKDTSGGETQGGFQEVESPAGKENTEQEQKPNGFEEVDSSVGKDLGAGQPAQNQPGTGGAPNTPSPGTGGGSTAGPALQVRPAAALAAGQPAAYHIFATGSRLGWAGGLARYSEGPADQAIIDHLMAAGEHARMANFESYPPTKAWPGWTQIKAQFTSWAQLIARYRNDTVRRQVATAVPGSAETLAQQVSVQTVGTTMQMPNCDAAYMRLGFYLSYGQQTLSIAQEAATHHGSSELVARAQADAVNHLVEADRILINYQNIRVASGRCADLRDVRAQLEALLRVPNILGQVPAVIAAWKTALERIMALSAAGPPSSTSYDECLKKYCPMCGQAISLLGVSAANDCDPCKTRNAQLISACVAGGQSQAARQQPSGPPSRVGTTGAASQRAQTQPKDPGELEGTWFLCACNILGGRPRMYWMDNSGPHTLAEFVNYCSKARTQYHSAQEMSANHGQIPDFLVQFTKSGGQYSGKNAPGSRRLTGEDPMWDINHHQPFEEMYRLARTGPGSYQGQGLACHSCTPGSPLVWSPTTITVQGDVATENTFGNAGSPYQQVWVRTASPPAGAGQPAAPSQRTNYPNSINLLGVEAPAAPSPKPQ